MRSARPRISDGITVKVPVQREQGDPFQKKTVSSRRRIGMLPSEWVHEFVRIKDADTGTVNRMDFGERRYLLRPYNTPRRRVLLFTSRQTEKSTTLGNKVLSLSGMRSIYTTLFVTPSAMQTKVFSTARIDDIVDVSPMIRAMTHKSLVQNLLEKEFINRSKIYLRYAFLSADRIRGLSVNGIFLDEIQDLLQELLPVIEETASHHKDSLFFYSGTPKTYDNTIEEYWSKHSTQGEWAIPCERHGTPKDPSTWHWNTLGIKNIGKYGPICDLCGGPLNPEHPLADWVEMNPGAQIEGFRICRLMVPWFFKDKNKWNEILHALARYPVAQFYNEVLALSYDSGAKPLTRGEVVRCCDDNYEVENEDFVAELALQYSLYVGIDWGEGTGNGAYTVMTVGGYVRGDDKFQIVFCKRFTGPLADPVEQLKEIKRLLVKFRFKFAGCDYGYGFFQNKELINVHGAGKIFPFQYVGRAPAKLLYKAALHRYITFRSLVMADIFQAIKCGTKIRFPRWDQFKDPFADDMLNIRAEPNEQLKMIQYIKIKGRTDDTFHSIVYCFLASMFEHRRPDIMAPIRENSEEAKASYNEEHMREMLEPMAPTITEMEEGTVPVMF